MATVEVGTARPSTPRDRAAAIAKTRDESLAMSLLHAIASLRLTVTLFALSMFLVFAGTLAQVDRDVWDVVNHGYFHTWIATIEWRALGRFLGMFTSFKADSLTGGFWFAGGKLIGVFLAANLLAAHALRFKVVATGKQLWAGLGFVTAGLIVVWLVIASGTNNTVESQLSPSFNNALWHALRGGTALLALAGAYLAVLSFGRIRSVEWALLATLDVLLVSLAVWLFLNPEARLDPAGLRILWQLAQGSGAAILLLAGCILLFHKRGGVVLLHGGVGLLMVSVFWTGMVAKESNMAIDEGQEVSSTYDTREVELAIIDSTSPEEDRVTVVPESILKAAAESGKVISSSELPFDVKIVRYLQNSTPAPLGEKQNPATAGAGLQVGMEDVRAATGVDTKQGIDFPSAYIEFLEKQSGESLGTFLVSTWGEDWLRMRKIGPFPFLAQVQGALAGQSVDAGPTKYDIALRFKRDYKDYSVELKEFRFDRYVGTNTAKNFSSLVQLRNPERSIDRQFLIWMNNPLRYGSDTLYQSSFDENREQGTILQVVTNPGWMAPYVACVVVGFGMAFHFILTLLRFVDRRNREAAYPQTGAAQSITSQSFGLHSFSSSSVWFPTLIVILFGGYILGKARIPTDQAAEMQVQQFGALPLADGGRIKPFDTLARNTLQILSGKQVVEKRAKTLTERLTLSGPEPTPATTWLLDTISQKPDTEDYRVFRIDNLDVLEVLGLEPRLGFFCYSFKEINEKQASQSPDQPPRSELDRQIGLAANVPDEERDLFQKKIIELANKRQLYMSVVYSFASPDIRFKDEQSIRAELAFATEQAAKLREAHSPRSVAPASLEDQWHTLFEAELNVLFRQAAGQQVNPATAALAGSLLAYAKGETREFNSRLAQLDDAIQQYASEVEAAKGTEQLAGLAPAERLSLSRVNFEVFFNHFSPFYYAAVLYLVAFVLAALSWLGWSLPLSRASTWLITLTFLLHTFAIIARIYISGRPPVTNLYSSAVFIGWACVLIGLILEGMYKLGIGNIVASVAGFSTLVIAHKLALDGDTFTVLQAVLDTQFWLATHVVTITLGYSTTLLAGTLGILYVLFGHVFSRFSSQQRQQLTRMIYGTLCFSILFSFIGTVLGGLWADDSWGRFWGWDPKENGALLIVLWNAIVLHARWGALVGQRGMANLAVFGNIVTAWSWFGVNQLGVGLHSYGFTDGVAKALMWFGISQIAIVILGCLPSEMFHGGPKRSATA